MTRRLYRPLLTLSIAVLAAGCSLVKAPSPVQRYTLALNSPRVAECSRPLAAGPLKVMAPQTSRFLDSDRIAVRNEARELMVYQGARWQDRAPVLLRDALVESLQNKGCIGTVISSAQAIQAPLMLTGQLSTFEGDYQQQPGHVSIALALYLSDTRTSQLVSSRRFTITRAISGSGTRAAVNAFGQATEQLATEVNQWLRPHLVALSATD